MAAAIVLAISVAPNALRADESVAAGNTAAESAVEAATPAEKALSTPEPHKPVLFWRLSEALSDAPPVLRDAQWRFNIRGYGFDREVSGGQADSANAIGGELFFQTGRMGDLAQIGLSYHDTNLFGKAENPGSTGLARQDGGDLSVLSEAYVDIGKPGGLRASLYRRGTNIPYLDRVDSRMIPRTQEGYVILRADHPLEFGVAHFTQTKSADSDRFVPMSEAAGATGGHRGVSAAGLKYKFDSGASLGAFDLYGWDMFNTLYLEGSWSSYLLKSSGTKIAAQFTDQRSVGDGLVGDFHTWHGGIKWAGSVKSTVLTLAYTQVGDGGPIQFPWGGFPSFNWGMLADFDRPGERSWRLGASMTGTPWGAESWSGFIDVIRGFGARDPSDGSDAPDETETSLTLDYKPKSGWLQGVWIRLRGGYVNVENDNDLWNVRLIVNYEIPLL